MDTSIHRDPVLDTDFWLFLLFCSKNVLHLQGRSLEFCDVRWRISMILSISWRFRLSWIPKECASRPCRHGGSSFNGSKNTLAGCESRSNQNSSSNSTCQNLDHQPISNSMTPPPPSSPIFRNRGGSYYFWARTPDLDDFWRLRRENPPHKLHDPPFEPQKFLRLRRKTPFINCMTPTRYPKFSAFGENPSDKLHDPLPDNSYIYHDQNSRKTLWKIAWPPLKYRFFRPPEAARKFWDLSSET